jgi:hypothetical protein
MLHANKSGLAGKPKEDTQEFNDLIEKELEWLRYNTECTKEEIDERQAEFMKKVNTMMPPPPTEENGEPSTPPPTTETGDVKVEEID